MPDAPYEVITLAARYVGWLFVFDHQAVENAALSEVYRALDPAGVLEHGRARGSEPGGRHFLDTLLDLRRQIIERGGAVLLPELADGLAGYLDACAREGPWRVEGRVPALADYLRDRAATGGCHVLYLHRLAFLPVTAGAGHERLPSELVDLAEQAFLIGGLANDLISWRFENDHADPVNLVTVLAHHYRLDTAEAFRAAVVVHAAIKDQFDLRCARLAAAPGRCDPGMVTAISGWVNGCAAAAETYWQDDRRHYARQEG